MKTKKNDNRICHNGSTSLHGMLGMYKEVSEKSDRQGRFPLSQACRIQECRSLYRLWQVYKNLSQWRVPQAG